MVLQRDMHFNISFLYLSWYVGVYMDSMRRRLGGRKRKYFNEQTEDKYYKTNTGKTEPFRRET